MLTNCWKRCLSFYSTFAPFLPWGFLPGFEESNFSTSVANFSCFFHFISSNTFPHLFFSLFPLTRGRPDLIHHYSQTLPRCFTTIHTMRLPCTGFYCICRALYCPKNTERACIRGPTLYFWGLSPNDKTSSGTEQVHRRAKDPVEIVVFVSPFFFFCITGFRTSRCFRTQQILHTFQDWWKPRGKS